MISEKEARLYIYNEKLSYHLILSKKKESKVSRLKNSENGIIRRWTNLNFLFGQFLATSHFADLVGLVVATGSARCAIVFAHAADAFAATFPLLFRLFFAVHAGIVAVGCHVSDRVFEAASRRRDAGDLGVGSFAAGTFHRRRSVLPFLFLPAIRAGRKGALRRER